MSLQWGFQWQSLICSGLSSIWSPHSPFPSPSPAASYCHASTNSGRESIPLAATASREATAATALLPTGSEAAQWRTLLCWQQQVRLTLCWLLQAEWAGREPPPPASCCCCGEAAFHRCVNSVKGQDSKWHIGLTPHQLLKAGGAGREVCKAPPPPFRPMGGKWWGCLSPAPPPPPQHDGFSRWTQE